MDIRELSLSPREQRTLESMGFDTVEKIALCKRDDLGLGKAKGDAIIKRAWNILANRSLSKIDTSETQIIITLTDVTPAIVASLEGILGSYDYLREEIKGKDLVIYKPLIKECKCSSDGNYLCLECGIGLCEKCRYVHEHKNIAEIHYLTRLFDTVKQKAQRLEFLKPSKQKEDEGVSSEEVMAIGRQLGFTGFADKFFSELEGNELMKRSLTCALFSAPEEPVHVLVIGDPAGGKTMAKDIIARRLGQGIEIVGANTTRSGLVCNLATGERGALTYSDGKIVLVDELDKIPERDIEYCLELLSNGKCSVHAARVHDTIESHFIMIAFANPEENIFKKDPINEIGLLPVLLSRFALIVKAEVLEAEHRRALIKRKLLGGVSDPEDANWLLSWLREAKKYNPKFEPSEAESERYLDRVDTLVEKHLDTPLRRDMRMGDYAKRVPYAIARASFSNIDGKILEQAIQLIEESINAW